jgi:hypothetical protein
MSWSVCQHNQIKTIDRALLAGAELANLSRTYGLELSALRRHQERLQRKMAQAGQRFQVNLHQGLFIKLSQVMEMVFSVVRGARTGGDYKFFLQASREFTRVSNLMHKMAAKLQLDPEFIYCLLASPQWDLQEEALLPSPIQALADNRQSLKTGLFAPCPDAPSEPEPEQVPASPLSPPVSLVQPAATGTPAPPKRHRSATKATKTAGLEKIKEENQKVGLEEKNLPPQRASLLQRIFHKWEKSGKKVGNPGWDYIIIK